MISWSWHGAYDEDAEQFKICNELADYIKN